MLLGVMYGGGRLFGPYPVPMPYNSHTYLALLQDIVFPEIRAELGERLWARAGWQQDGARLHTADIVMQYLDGVFGRRVLSGRSLRGREWAPYSPDLSPCDFFLHGYLKEKVYRPMPGNLVRLQEACNNVFMELDQDLDGKEFVRCTCTCISLYTCTCTCTLILNLHLDLDLHLHLSFHLHLPFHLHLHQRCTIKKIRQMQPAV